MIRKIMMLWSSKTIQVLALIIFSVAYAELKTLPITDEDREALKKSKVPAKEFAPGEELAVDVSLYLMPV